jgi:hypothetical protein
MATDPMSLRIGFDLDGVLADLEGELVRRAEHVAGRSTAPSPTRAAAGAPTFRRATSLVRSALRAAVAFWRRHPGEDPAAGQRQPAADEAVQALALASLRLTRRQQRQLWERVAATNNFWETLDETEPGAVGRLGRAAAERRWTIVFLTSRPATAGAPVQAQSARWLEAKGFPSPDVHLVEGSRGRVAQTLGLDFVFDDRPDNCLDVLTESRARPVLVRRVHAAPLLAAARRLGIQSVDSIDECVRFLRSAEESAVET